jgi:hypothetical protein
MGFFKRFFGGKETEAVSEKPVKKEKKIKLDTDVDGFKSIDMFNTDAYIENTFEQLFHAVKVDAWPCNYSYSEMEFKKDSVTLKIEFAAYDNFKIKRIILTSGYSNYYYRSDLDSEVYQFFYEVYVKSITKQNEDLKKIADSNLESINKVLGRDTIRDSKIDWLLNGE